MTPIDAAILVLILALPLHWLVLRHFDQISEPAYLRSHGVVVIFERALQAQSEPIGEYMGRPIWGSVTFKGIHYRYDHVLDPRCRERIAPGELFLEPGLVYVVV
jgi:hypothetical protein